MLDLINYFREKREEAHSSIIKMEKDNTFEQIDDNLVLKMIYDDYHSRMMFLDYEISYLKKISCIKSETKIYLSEKIFDLEKLLQDSSNEFSSLTKEKKLHYSNDYIAYQKHLFNAIDTLTEVKRELYSNILISNYLEMNLGNDYA
jgi:hypothetical protein